MAIDNVMQCECVFVAMSSKPLKLKIKVIKIMNKYYRYFHYYHNEQHAKLPNIVHYSHVLWTILQKINNGNATLQEKMCYSSCATYEIQNRKEIVDL